MKNGFNVVFAAFALLLVCFGSAPARAQSIYFGVSNIALKNGESTEFGDVYLVNRNCKSVLTETPHVEILDGPPGVTADIKPAKVVPRSYGCAQPVAGGKLIISAKDIEEVSRTRMVLRFSYKTRSGERQRSHDINVSLFP